MQNEGCFVISAGFLTSLVRRRWERERDLGCGYALGSCVSLPPFTPNLARQLTQMKPGVLDRVLEIQPVAKELGDLAREDQGSSLSLLVKEAFPLVYSGGMPSQLRKGHKQVNSRLKLTLRSPLVFDLIHRGGQLRKHVVRQTVVRGAVKADLPAQVGWAGDLQERHGQRAVGYVDVGETDMGFSCRRMFA